jgi:DNA-binding transcriptional LysR family regulator
MLKGLPEDLDLLIALDVLLRERHVTRAAKRLGITQSAASQRLARLREYFGDRLLTPGRPLLALTPRAQAMVDPLASAIAGLRAALQMGAPFAPETSQRRFVLLGDDLLEALALPLLLPMFASQAPGVSLQCERIDADFAQRLERGSADLAFVPEFLAPPSLRRMPLPQSTFVTLLRRNHPQARRQLKLEPFLQLGHLLVAPRGLPGSLVDRALAALGHRRRVVAQVQHFVSAPYVVANTDLVVTCPGTITPLAEALQLHIARPPLELGIDHTCTLWHERVHDDPGHRWLRSLLEQGLKAQKRQRRS